MREETIGGQRLICGDCLEVLPTLAESSVDLIATDPPYGIAFMGKQWDKSLPDPRVWQECLRVLKPGGSAVVMSGARLDCLWRVCRDLEQAGFELEQTALFWCYRSGFPKGQDLSKAADARAGAEREVVGEAPSSANRTETTFHGAEYKGGYTTTAEGPRLITAPATDLARDLDGWFTKGKVKPAVEVIIWARKPNSERTELDNMVRWGVGGVNCGACMVPFGSDIPKAEVRYSGNTPNHVKQADGINTRPGIEAAMSAGEPTHSYNPGAGRFPANLLVTDEALGSDDSRYFDISRWAQEHGYSDDWAAAAEAGLLQVAKPSRGEKNAGCERLPEKSVRPQGNGFAECTIFNGENGDEDWRAKNPSKPAHNAHPTCKPVTLFAYLIEFLTRPGATVLDPFLGSGTTLVAAAATGRAGIGIELSADYLEIAAARVRHAQPPQLSLAAE